MDSLEKWDMYKKLRSYKRDIKTAKVERIKANKKHPWEIGYFSSSGDEDNDTESSSDGEGEESEEEEKSERKTKKGFQLIYSKDKEGNPVVIKKEGEIPKDIDSESLINILSSTDPELCV